LCRVPAIHVALSMSIEIKKSAEEAKKEQINGLREKEITL
jgi:hypothetical protein